MEGEIREASVALRDCLAVRAGEEVLVVTDPPLYDLGRAFREEALALGAEGLLLLMEPRENHGVEPPAAVAEAMRRAKVVLAVTSRSLSHTRARREACAAGARVASLPGLSAEVMRRALAVDYAELRVACGRLTQALAGAREVRLTSPAGTDLTLSLAGRAAHRDDGDYRAPGAFGNLPAGEVYAAPLEGTASGILVWDGSLAGAGLLEEPLRVTIQEGKAVRVEGGRAAAWLQGILERYGPAAANVAELGIGLNPQARLTGNVLEDEKVLGTVHVALGDNSTFGGKVEAPSHLDGVLREPTLMVDGRPLLLSGQPAWEAGQAARWRG